jgi:hypothetical protein
MTFGEGHLLQNAAPESAGGSMARTFVELLFEQAAMLRLAASDLVDDPERARSLSDLADLYDVRAVTEANGIATTLVNFLL